MPSPIFLSEAYRIFRRNLRVKSKGFQRYSGNADEICRQIVDACFNGRYFQTSLGNFNQFWTRDFGFCADSLLKLGYVDKVKSTLSYAMERFAKYGKVTTTITPSGKAYDFPCYAVDSLAYLIRSLRAANAGDLVLRYRDFLNKEVIRFYNLAIDKDKRSVRTDKRFSSMKDYAVRKSSCYDNVMAAMLANELKQIKILENPFVNYDFKKIIKDKFWTGEYFLDDLSGSSFVAGDANIFPFFAGVFDNKKMLKSAIGKIQENNLDKPFPLKYANDAGNGRFIFLERLVYGYERGAIWMHMGPLYAQLVKKVDKDKAQEYKMMYKKAIEKYGNFLEVFDASGRPFKTAFYYCDESMLWAANYLNL